MKIKEILLPITLCLCSMMSCNHESENRIQINKKELTDELAIYYYQSKFRNFGKDYVSYMQSCDSAPTAYKNRMQNLILHHAKDLKADKKGIDSICVAQKHYNDKQDLAYVFLNVHYKDKSSEEVILPLVKVNKEWKIR